VNVKKIGTYLALAFGLSWGLVFTFFALGGELNSVGFVAMAVVDMFTPAAAAITQRFIWKAPLKDLGIQWPRWRWMLVAWFAPLVIVIAALALSLLVPGVSLAMGLDGLYGQLSDKLSPQQLAELHAKLDHSVLATPGMLPAIGLVQVLVAGATINAVAAFGEELGWRGFLFNELRALGFWRSSFVIGILWGVWHAPLIAHGYNYPGHPIAGPAMMTLLTTLIAPLIGYARLRANSVFAAAVFHGTLNAAAGLVILLRGANAMTTGILGFTGMIVLACANVALWIYSRRPESIAQLN
jgi:membrane protease YdiL (CAAX protease family)